jgi:hypothetical protein
MECLLGRVFSLNVVSGPASGVFSRDASVFVSSRILHYRLSDIIRENMEHLRYLSHYYRKPIYDEGQVIKRGTYAFTAQRASP